MCTKQKMALAKVVFNVNKILLPKKNAFNFTYAFLSTTSTNANQQLHASKLNKHLKLCKQSTLTLNSSLANGLLRSSEIHLHSHRCYSSQSDSNDSNEKPVARSIPKFDDTEPKFWPSPLEVVKGWFYALYIRFTYDPEFSLSEFITGSKQALQVRRIHTFSVDLILADVHMLNLLLIKLQVVSQKLASGDWDGLSNLITAEELERIKPIVQPMSVSQRNELGVKKDDIFFAYPYEVRFKSADNFNSVLFVQILMGFQVLRGLKELQESDVDIPYDIG